MKKQIIGALMLVVITLSTFNNASAAWRHYHREHHRHHHRM